MLPPYYLYDETDRNALHLDVFEDYNGAVFEELTEYSVVLTKIILEYTQKEVRIPLFNNVFIWQWLTDIPLSDVKYVEVGLGMVAGIGAILAHYTGINNAINHDKFLKKYKF